MILVADANVLVAELLRRRGQDLIESGRLQLSIAQSAREETDHELKKRIDAMIQQGRVNPLAGERLLATATNLVNVYVTLIPEFVYSSWESRSRRRVHADPDDWPTVALALALDAGIWTHDNDFLGCGCVTWRTETLLAELEFEAAP